MILHAMMDHFRRLFRVLFWLGDILAEASLVAADQRKDRRETEKKRGRRWDQSEIRARGLESMSPFFRFLFLEFDGVFPAERVESPIPRGHILLTRRLS